MTAAALAAAGIVKWTVPLEGMLWKLLLEMAVFGGAYLLAGLALREPFLEEEIIARFLPGRKR